MNCDVFRMFETPDFGSWLKFVSSINPIDPNKCELVSKLLGPFIFASQYDVEFGNFFLRLMESWEGSLNESDGSLLLRTVRNIREEVGMLVACSDQVSSKMKCVAKV
ncbi:MAG: hypothetical protein V1645_01485 [archaeon]